MKQQPILIQGAMEEEIAKIKQEMKEIEEKNIQGYQFYQGKIDGYPIVLSKTKVGLIHVTAATVIAMLEFSPCLIINQGVAGGVTRQVHKGDIIVGKSCININSFQTPYKEEGKGSNALEWKLKTFKEGIDELVVLEANEKLVQLAQEELTKQHMPYQIGRIGSGDVWNAEKDRLLWLGEKYQVICEDMETIGSYQIGKQFKIPTIGIRILSDNMLLEEKYDKTVGKQGQEFILHFLKHILQSK